jgi:drug/metabolite transporter (DMT)-like permease
MVIAVPRITVAAVLASVSSAAIWGLYPVLARYLMLRQPGEPPATSVLAIVCFWNTIIVGTYYAYTKLIVQNSEQTNDHKIITTIENVEDIKIEAEIEEKTASVTVKQKIQVALAYGVLCLSRMITNMQSVSMTKAYLTQMTALSLPFFTAFLAYILLNEKIHTALYPSLFVMMMGSLIVLYGQGAFQSNDSDHDGDNNDFTTDDVYGILLQLASVVLSAMLKIAFKSTEVYLNTVELLLAQFSVTAVPLLIYSYIFERESLLYVLYGLEIRGWLALIGISLGIYMLGNYLQIYAVRSIGASNHSATNSIRLVSAVLVVQLY